MELDRNDARLLAAIQRNNRVPSDVLGDSLGLSASAVQRRMKRLRAEGVIEADVAIVNPLAVGHSVSAVVLVGLARERSDIIDRFKSAIRTDPRVMCGYYVTGDADFVLIVNVEDMASFERFAQSFFNENADVSWFRTMLCMDRVKASSALPIDPGRFG